MNIVNDKIYQERVYQIVRQIPVGKVMTYGQLAIILVEGYTARTVGYVMGGSDEGVPWQRVINSQGKCSTGRLTIPLNLQQELLEAEGIIFSASGKCDLGSYQWFPEGCEPDDEEQISLFQRN
jgi:methylated-DNA-protein-cysteine methyltransferase-like protein